MVNQDLRMSNPPAFQNRNRHLVFRGGMFLRIFLLLIDKVEREV